MYILEVRSIVFIKTKFIVDLKVNILSKFFIGISLFVLHQLFYFTGMEEKCLKLLLVHSCKI